MARIPHGGVISLEQLQTAHASVASFSATVPLGFTAATTVDLKDFDFLFPDLQTDPNNLLPEATSTRDNLVRLGQTMHDVNGSNKAGDSTIPAIFTYFGQFVDHDITLEAGSASAEDLVKPGLVPLPVDKIRQELKNTRTATLDLDSVYDPPAVKNGPLMVIGDVTKLNGGSAPTLRPPGKDDKNDLNRKGRSPQKEIDREALIGDPRNDENTIVAQLHVAFLRAHNAIVGQGKSFDEARRLLRQHYQHIVINDFLMTIADPKVVKKILKDGNQVFDGLAEPFFMPLEFSVAAYRFGHTMVRADYNFNLNFNTSNKPGTTPATLELLFTFTALQGQLGFGTAPGSGFDTLPDNWIIQWENFIGSGKLNRARRIDTQLVEPLFTLKDFDATPLPGEISRLAVRNLLRGYLLRMPTGQAVAQALKLKPLKPSEIEAVAATVKPLPGGEKQVDVVRDAGFSQRTPLWYYVLAEGAARGDGQHLGPVGSTIIAEVLIGLIRRSDDSILRTAGWKPTLPSKKKGTFTLEDLLRLAGVL
jgi:hypothetical protein